ncbi:hypothetical protein RF11_00877 [Thelohanellus kitauei]|uniref:Uncharacterized protein n=1 Tax=Thelohanellus kitauei TaxID=669202 RepID=A0A0C2NCB5_THEKT|nr:hypothetical protein RF11_00877 [Thelohanellus kitauei]
MLSAPVSTYQGVLAGRHPFIRHDMGNARVSLVHNNPLPLNCRDMMILEFIFEEELKKEKVVQTRRGNKFYSNWSDDVTELSFYFDLQYHMKKYEFTDIGVDLKILNTTELPMNMSIF